MGVALIVAFLIVPIAEIYVIVQVGQQIGALPTIALLLMESAIGAWLVKREGRRAWRALRDAVGTGRLPSRELSDAALILVGGTLLLTPGFLSDIVGFFFILPVTRPLARRMLSGIVARRAGRMVSRRVGPLPPRRGRTVPGQVVRDPRDPGTPGPTGPDRAR
ncbi:MAG: protein FxsA [Actinomycetota bacterium]|nr:protein FxsA [Actinomycetota bacterium]